MTTPAEPAQGAVSFGPVVGAFMLAGLLVTSQIYVLIPLFGALGAAWERSVTSITLLPTIFAVFYGIGQAVWGPASDRFGRRLVLTAGVGMTGVLTAALAAAGSLAVASVIVAAQGFVASSFSPGALAYLAERIEAPRRALAVSLLTSSFFASAVVGQVCAQLVLDRLGADAVFLLFGGALLISAAWVARTVQAAAPRTSVPASLFGPMLGLLRNGRIMLAIGASIGILGSFVAVYTGLELMGPAGLRSDAESLLWLRASGLAALVAVPFIALRSARVDPALRATASLLTAAASLLLVAVVGDDPVTLGAVLLVFVLAIASTSPAIAQVVVRESGPAAGAGMGLWGFFLFVGASGGPQLAAALRPAGFDALLVVLAAMLFVAGGLASRCGGGRSAPRAVDRGAT